MRLHAYIFLLLGWAFLNAGTVLAQTMHEFTGAPGELTRVFYIHQEDRTALHYNNSAGLWSLLPFDDIKTEKGLFRPNLSVLPVVSATQYNSDRPWGPNSGPVWAGRGFTQSYSAGVAVQWFLLDTQVRPIYTTVQNRDYRTPDKYLEGQALTRYNSFYTGFDHPVRIDSVSTSFTYLGDSWVKLAFGPISAGVSNQNLWWGPGRRSTLFMTNDGAGFNHATVHTNRPLNLYALNLQFQYIAARLERSHYNPINHIDDWRFLTALVVDVEPRFMPGLHVGLIRAFHIRERDIKSRSDYFPLFQPFAKSSLPAGDSPLQDGSAPDDQRASVYFSWGFPDAGFTFYGEYGRTDHASDVRDFLLQPHHARAYMMGFHKTFETDRIEPARWSLSAEIMDASNTTSSRVRLWRQGQQAYDINFYAHGAVRHGFTHLGQPLGSWYAASSSGWFVSLQRSVQSFDAGLLLEHIRKNRVTYLSLQEINDNARQEREIIAGGYFSKRFLNTLDARVGVYRVASRNRYYLPLVSSDPDNDEMSYYNPVNWNMQVTISWRPQLRW